VESKKYKNAKARDLPPKERKGPSGRGASSDRCKDGVNEKEKKMKRPIRGLWRTLLKHKETTSRVSI